MSTTPPAFPLSAPSQNNSSDSNSEEALRLINRISANKAGKRHASPFNDSSNSNNPQSLTPRALNYDRIRGTLKDIGAITESLALPPLPPKIGE